MRTLTLSIFMLVWAPNAFAHDGTDHGEPAWSFDPAVIAPLLLLAAMYCAGSVAIARRARPARIRRRQALLYAAGWLSLAGALVSPLHWLGEHLFTFHMIEHEIIMAIAAPLLVLSRPLGVLLWSCPGSIRQQLGRVWQSGASAVAAVGLLNPAVSTVMHGLAIWIWHVPQLFDAAVVHEWAHRLQHLSFLLTALLFWWSLLRRANYGTATWHMFATMIHTSILGALIALAPSVLYRSQTLHASDWGLTPLEDQQLAGLVMWVPAGTIYAGATLVFAALWIARSSRASGGEHVVHPS